MAPHPPARLHGEHAAATTQTVILVPALVVAFLLAAQAAVVAHASHLVTGAAQHAATAAQAENGSTTAGRRAADAFLDRRANQLLHHTQVHVTRSRDRTHVEVRARVPTLVPGYRWEVTGTADGPSERFRNRLER